MSIVWVETPRLVGVSVQIFTSYKLEIWWAEERLKINTEDHIKFRLKISNQKLEQARAYWT